MLNRLMFVYFIQKKGFLDGDRDYLRNRMRQVRARARISSISFYRYFLLRLFHEGLGKLERGTQARPRTGKAARQRSLPQRRLLRGPPTRRTQHRHRNPRQGIREAVRLLRRLQLASRRTPAPADNEINPDVLGYIFEKYINQKQMGAYYTKEDITEYISKNTIIPFLFDAAQKKCPIAFKPESFLWRLLHDDPDRYIYPAVRTV